MFIALFATAKRCEQPRYPPFDGRMGSTHTVEYDSAMKRSEALTQATAWTDLEHRMLSERSQTQKDTQCVIPFAGNVQNRLSPQRRRVG